MRRFILPDAGFLIKASTPVQVAQPKIARTEAFARPKPTKRQRLAFRVGGNKFRPVQRRPALNWRLIRACAILSWNRAWAIFKLRSGGRQVSRFLRGSHYSIPGGCGGFLRNRAVIASIFPRRIWVPRRTRPLGLIANSAAGHLLLFRPYFDESKPIYPLEYPLDELLMIHRLACGEGVEMHAVGIVDEAGLGHLFLGHSGAGKSTTARLWKSESNAQILSDDRIILRVRDGRIWMYGTPWHGDAGIASPESAPLSRLYLLEHSNHTRAGRFTAGTRRCRAFHPQFRAASLAHRPAIHLAIS